MSGQDIQIKLDSWGNGEGGPILFDTLLTEEAFRKAVSEKIDATVQTILSDDGVNRYDISASSFRAGTPSGEETDFDFDRTISGATCRISKWFEGGNTDRSEITQKRLLFFFVCCQRELYDKQKEKKRIPLGLLQLDMPHTISQLQHSIDNRMTRYLFPNADYSRGEEYDVCLFPVLYLTDYTGSSIPFMGTYVEEDPSILASQPSLPSDIPRHTANRRVMKAIAGWTRSFTQVPSVVLGLDDPIEECKVSGVAFIQGKRMINHLESDQLHLTVYKAIEKVYENRTDASGEYRKIMRELKNTQKEKNALRVVALSEDATRVDIQKIFIAEWSLSATETPIYYDEVYDILIECKEKAVVPYIRNVTTTFQDNVNGLFGLAIAGASSYNQNIAKIYEIYMTLHREEPRKLANSMLKVVSTILELNAFKEVYDNIREKLKSYINEMVRRLERDPLSWLGNYHDTIATLITKCIGHLSDYAKKTIDATGFGKISQKFVHLQKLVIESKTEVKKTIETSIKRQFISYKDERNAFLEIFKRHSAVYEMWQKTLVSSKNKIKDHLKHRVATIEKTYFGEFDRALLPHSRHTILIGVEQRESTVQDLEQIQDVIPFYRDSVTTMWPDGCDMSRMKILTAFYTVDWDTLRRNDLEASPFESVNLQEITDSSHDSDECFYTSTDNNEDELYTELWPKKWGDTLLITSSHINVDGPRGPILRATCSQEDRDNEDNDELILSDDIDFRVTALGSRTYTARTLNGWFHFRLDIPLCSRRVVFDMMITATKRHNKYYIEARDRRVVEGCLVLAGGQSGSYTISPIISGEYLVFTPREESASYCLVDPSFKIGVDAYFVDIYCDNSSEWLSEYWTRIHRGFEFDEDYFLSFYSRDLVAPHYYRDKMLSTMRGVPMGNNPSPFDPSLDVMIGSSGIVPYDVLWPITKHLHARSFFTGDVIHKGRHINTINRDKKLDLILYTGNQPILCDVPNSMPLITQVETLRGEIYRGLKTENWMDRNGHLTSCAKPLFMERLANIFILQNKVNELNGCFDFVIEEHDMITLVDFVTELYTKK